MFFFKVQKTVSYQTPVNLDAYKAIVNKHTGFYLTDIQDGIQVKWKIGRGIFLFATCEFILGVDNNTIKITTALNQAILYQGIVVLWIILASLLMILEPKRSTINSVIFSSTVIIGIWGYIILNRNKLLKMLSPHNIPTESYSALTTNN